LGPDPETPRPSTHPPVFPFSERDLLHRVHHSFLPRRKSKGHLTSDFLEAVTYESDDPIAFASHESGGPTEVRRSLRSSFPIHVPTPASAPAQHGHAVAASRFTGFGSMPLELLWRIAGMLDIVSVLRYRQVNRRAREAVTALPEYHLTVQFALDALLALLRVEIAPYCTFSDIAALLRQSTCSVGICDKPGPFVFLPTMQRCCPLCLRTSPELQAMRVPPKDEEKYKRHRSSKFRLVHALPGCHAPAYDIKYGRHYLVAKKALPTIGLTEPVYEPNGWQPFYPNHYRGVFARVYRKDPFLAINNMETITDVEPGPKLSEKYKIPASRFTTQYACAIILPFLDMIDRKPQLRKGLHCRGCHMVFAAWEERGVLESHMFHFSHLITRTYTVTEYMKHYKWCSAAWALSQDQKCGWPTQSPDIGAGDLMQRYSDAVGRSLNNLNIQDGSRHNSD
jgi:hypothetical protein